MAKFRKNHETSQKTGFNGLFLRFLVFAILICVLFVYLYKNMDGLLSGASNWNGQQESIESVIGEDRIFVPEGSIGERVDHKYYSLSYNEQYELSDWVAYRLTEASLKVKNVPRAKRFKSDPLVDTYSAKHRDYSNSGYTRGHMAPAGDMAFSVDAMQESFYMSNMMPQKRANNNGIWKELEETTRDWAYTRDDIIVITGPIYQNIRKYIGQNRIAVPDKFYKILCDDKEEEMIGFIIPNNKCYEPLPKYAVSIDEIEKLTGLDFFNQIFSDRQEEYLESKVDLSNWKFSDKRYKLRVDKWNEQ